MPTYFKLIGAGLLVAALGACGQPARPAAAPATQPAALSAAGAVQPIAAQKAPVAALLYLWPARLPGNFAVQSAASSGDGRSWTLSVVDIDTGQPGFTIVGGVDSPAAVQPPTEGSAEVMVRSLTAQAFPSGDGYSIRWSEGGQPYALLGDLDLNKALQIADGLEALDLASWQARPTQGTP